MSNVDVPMSIPGLWRHQGGEEIVHRVRFYDRITCLCCPGAVALLSLLHHESSKDVPTAVWYAPFLSYHKSMSEDKTDRVEER
jgi:hypothetical protein